MNARQLKKLGSPDDCVPHFITAIQSAAKAHRFNSGCTAKSLVRAVVGDPESYYEDPDFGEAAKAIVADRNFVRPEPITYRTWGEDIDEGSHEQMRNACSLPTAVGAALMPDAHLGYGLPIGGVLALENSVCPFAVGVDIACRMRISIFDIPMNDCFKGTNRYEEAIAKGTLFGVGQEYDPPKEHPVMDEDWDITKVTRQNKDKARGQLGTSGSGNHFAEFGRLTLSDSVTFTSPYLHVDKQPYVQDYVAFMTHSGSRGAGAQVCNTYSGIAQSKLPSQYKDLGRLAWLDMDTEAGMEYWLAMELMGRYAAANHDIIHRAVAKALGANIIGGVENHHNFAWKETHFGKEVIVHRKGATPAGDGVLGVIPGSMATPAYLVKGKGNPLSLCSASHGAGRRLSRRKAKELYTWNAVKGDLEAKGVRVLSADADEVPYAYKDIDAVMAEQADLVSVVARFDPKIVKMCGDGSKAED